MNIQQNFVQKGASFGVTRPYIMSVGQFSAGDTLSVTTDLKANASGTAQIYVAKFNEDVFEEGFNKLSSNYMTTTKRTGSSMEGTINVAKSGLFYTSIPYEEGWTAYVDDKPVTITPVGGSMLAFELSEGQHTIRLSYIPKGFIPGLIISILGLGAFVIAIIIFRKYRKKHPYVEVTAEITDDVSGENKPGKVRKNIKTENKKNNFRQKKKKKSK